MRLYLAILVGKIIFYLTRIFKIGGGSAAPGLYALKIDPNLVKKLTKQIPINIIVTGTNGKTTTTRLIDHFAKTQGLKVLRNHTGSNLERGIASSLTTHSSLLTPHYSDLAIWEVDEAAFNELALKINPQIIVFLNVFRDQLDRYGEVDSIVNRWQGTVDSLPKDTLLILNGDDANVANLAKSFTGKIETFGVKDYSIKGESLNKISTHHKYNFEAKNIKTNGLSSTSFEFNIQHSTFNIHLPLPGIYHIYDFLAAFALGYHLNLESNKMISSLGHFSPAFGRVERVNFGSQEGWIFLIKNPAGATQVFQTIAPEFKKDDRLLIALNDNFADGKDVSWIWDANFEFIQNSSLREPEGSSEPRMARAQSRDFKIICSGTRADDLAVRLKYAGFNPEKIVVENNLEKALRLVTKEDKSFLRSPKGEGKVPQVSAKIISEREAKRVFILPTYTALLELQKILAKMGIKKHYWEEE